MRVLVIGGTAFVGPVVVSQLVTKGHEVAIFHRGLTSAPPIDGIHEFRGDRRDLYSFRRQFQDFAPEVVIDMVCMTEHHARATLDTFLGIAQRWVVISSQDVYRAFGRVQGTEPGPPDPVPLREDAPLREKRFLYRDSGHEGFEWMRDFEKIAVEETARSEPKLPVTVIRLPAVYGPGDYQHRLYGYAVRMADARPAILLDEDLAKWRWTRGYVENVAAAIGLAAQTSHSENRTYNVGDPVAFSELEWVKHLASAYRWNGKIVVVGGARLAVGLNTEQHWSVDTARIRHELGYEEPIPLEHALRHTMEWELLNPPPHHRPSSDQYQIEDAILAEAGL